MDPTLSGISAATSAVGIAELGQVGADRRLRTEDRVGSELGQPEVADGSARGGVPLEHRPADLLLLGEPVVGHRLRPHREVLRALR